MIANDSTDRRAAAVAWALSPHTWRDCTPAMLARLVVAALDAYDIDELMAEIPGVGRSVDEPLHPAADDDPRVEHLAGLLAGSQWRRRTLRQLSTEMVRALNDWHEHRERFEVELQRLLDES
jgi:phage terminase large subunit-like protein